jgi:Ca-activated chloride channel family protein
MSFATPGLLAALAAIPLAFVAHRLLSGRATRNVVRYPGVPTLAALVPAVPAWRRHLPPALFLLALTALIVALARPQTTVAVPVERASVVLVTDVSRSMLADDVEPSRLDAAREAGERFLDQVPDDLRIGSVTYADRPQIVESPSSDHDDAREVLDGLVADGGTATGDALQAALDTLDEERGRRPPAAIVLLSDGASTLGTDPIDAAREAGRQRVPVYTIALGTSSAVVNGPRGELIPVPPDPEALRRVANVSGGQAFRAQDDDQLDSVYERLGSQLGTKDEKREITAGFAAGGAVLLLLAAALSLRWTGRLP